MEKRYRYPGVQPFTEADKDIFFGREKDIDQVKRKLYLHNLVVLQSKSGFGKSSLINAGIKPSLSSGEADSENVFVTLQFNDISKRPLQLFYSYLESLISERKRILESVYKGTLTEDHTASTRLQLERVLQYDHFLDQIQSVSLWYYFKRLQTLYSYSVESPAYVNSENESDVLTEAKPIHFIIILDQFEKLLFYPYEKQSQVEDVGKELADLYYKKIPSRFIEALQLEKFKTEDSYINEDFFHFSENNPEWEDFLHTHPSISIIIGIRTDKLILIDRLSKFFPDLALHKYELSPLDIEGAKGAINKPAANPDANRFKSSSFTYDKGAVEKILYFLTHVEYTSGMEAAGTGSNRTRIEVYQLQMICQHIEEKIVTGDLKPEDDSAQVQVTENDIDNIENIVRNYYKNELNKFNNADRELVQRFIEENLVLEHERRRVSIDEGVAKNKLLAYGIDPDFLDHFIERLTEMRIIRREASNLDNIYHYELSHDTLITPVLELRRDRMLQEEKQKHEQALLYEKLKVRQARKRYIQLGMSMGLVIVALICIMKFIIQPKYEEAILNEQTAKELQAQSEKFREQLARASKSSEELSKVQNQLKYSTDSLKLIKDTLQILKKKYIDLNEQERQLLSLRRKVEEEQRSNSSQMIRIIEENQDLIIKNNELALAVRKFEFYRKYGRTASDQDWKKEEDNYKANFYNYQAQINKLKAEINTLTQRRSR